MLLDVGGVFYLPDHERIRAAGIRPVLVDPHDLHTGLDVERVRSLDQVAALVTAS